MGQQSTNNPQRSTNNPQRNPNEGGHGRQAGQKQDNDHSRDNRMDGDRNKEKKDRSGNKSSVEDK